MPNLFSFIVPSNRYYQHPESKDSLFVVCDDEMKKLLTKHLSVDGQKRTIVKGESYIKTDEKKAFEEYMAKEESFFFDYAKEYAKSPNIWHSFGILTYKGVSVRIPDYLSNFGDYDIFSRYDYYPDKDKVRFFAIARRIYSFAFKAIGEREDIAFFDRSSAIDKHINMDSFLTYEDFEN